ncbi:uncharacterized protein [Cicer arietinum]|uniref:Double-stranded RNA-binding protein 1-like isoform X2 n=1 Tax=Cicer arietinum TaxID=3827 RepID=A0A1S2XKU1_CICAR|nr:double-stranded RNA-binding protein 1-like isoform X2 [Cicer arietinum]
MASSLSQQPKQSPVSPQLSLHLTPTPMHKNRLQEFTQRSGMSFPVFETVNEGQSHAPQFRSTVWVDGMSFTSQLTFFHRKAAEQDASKLALECLTRKIKEEVYSFVSEVLNEYAAKLNKELPTYNTVQLQEVVPVFVCTVDFIGSSYTGDVARSKKDAKLLAARAAILSMLGNSDSEMLCQIIKSKSKMYCSSKVNTAHFSMAMDHRDKKVVDPVGNANINAINVVLPESDPIVSSCQQPEMRKRKPTPDAAKCPNESQQPGVVLPISDPVGSYHKYKEVASPIGNAITNEIQVVPLESGPITCTCQQPDMPKQESIPKATKSAGESQQSDATLIANGLSSKKRRIINRKANKKARLEAQLQSLSANQVFPCTSMAQ